ncbi:MAG: winged helix-turn-helix domain-containing protein [Actinomycetota bacterium]|nr:winged helix-turn-helix domain-containing protein [Actinomycetota bacterium]
MRRHLSELEERLAEILAKPVRTSADAEAAARAAEALLDILLARERAELALAPAAEARITTPGDLSGLTLHDAAQRVLEQAGIPLHVRELGKRIKGGGWRHPRSRNAPPEQIQFQLAARLPRYPDRFQRVAPNTFALVSWGKRTTERPNPAIGIAEGPRGEIARTIGERYDEPARTPWRSS